MKKLIYNIIVVILLLIAIFGDVQMAKSSINNGSNIQSSTSVSSTTGGFAVETEDVWTPTFQLCWNELINLINRNNDIEYVKGNPPLADELNKENYNKENINPDSYYIKVGKMTLNLKKQIEKDIKEKFNEKSDILNSFEFENVLDLQTNNYFIYSILIKNFPFEYAFTNIESEPFNNIQNTKYKYFGLSNESNIKDEQISNMKHLFYASDDDFAIEIYNKNQTETMILYLTDSNASFNEIYNEIYEKTKNSKEYTKKRVEEIIAKNPDEYKDRDKVINIIPFLKVPYISIDEKFSYNKELADKAIKGKNYETTGEYWIITDTLQTIKFNMNNEGAEIKSESAIKVMDKMAAARPSFITINLNDYYYFNRPFVIFIKETNQDKPYFAAKIKDGKYLVEANNKNIK